MAFIAQFQPWRGPGGEGGRIFSIEAFPFLETIFVDNFVTAAINKSDGFKVSSTKAFN